MVRFKRKSVERYQNCYLAGSCLELVKHIETLHVSSYRLALIEKESLQDLVCKSLRQVILNEWPDIICDGDPALRPFFQFRGELIIQGHLILCSSLLFVPKQNNPNTLRKEIMSLAHSSHIGLGSYLCRLRECMFWPGMNSQMKDFVGPCDVYLTHCNSQVTDPILQHDVSRRPWAKVAADLRHFSGHVLLVVSDYFRSPKKSKAVIGSLMAMFSR